MFDPGENVTINGGRYRAMITDYLTQCHFPHISSINESVDWLPRLYDITLLDFFLLGCVKSKVYSDNHALIQALEQNITRVICQLPFDMLERVIENLTHKISSAVFRQNFADKILNY